MHAKFQVAGFQNKSDKRHCSFNFHCLFLQGNLPVHATWWFLGSEIQTTVEDFRPIY